MLEYRVEKLNMETEEALFVLFNWLIALKTNSLFWNIQKVLIPKKKIQYDTLQFPYATFSKQK